MVREMDDIVTELLAKWAQLAGGAGAGSNKVLLVAELNRLNLETTTYTLYGHKLNQLSTATEHPMLKAMEDSTSEAMKRPTRPGFLNWLVYGSKFKKSTKVMRDYAAEIVVHRKSAASDGTDERKDLLHAMLHAKDPETGVGFTDSQVIDEIVTMPIGSSTAPCLLASAVYFLLQNPDVITKARAELDSVTGSYTNGLGSTPLTLEHLDRLEYTQGVLREALRMANPAPGFNIEPIPRKTEGGKEDKTPIQLAGGKYAIAHNQAMIVVLAGVNRDPAVFDEPLKFKPERMVGENFDALPAGVKKWFGNGKRECIGKHWAWQFSLITLARMIRDVDFESAVGPGWEFKQDGWFNVRPTDFVKVKPRAA
ncbi:cytochrome P450 [Microdochium bolleyi]|uniref:Cytochrome P450 n=1 Tax=Microdochium bolleyi TaxID=196109 RepID=A0A136IZW5_9PEZI|nr:cytochrome P450 [Microdochium bolleyi]